MKPEELESKVKSLTETVGKLEARVTRLEDIEAIKKLQRSYGFYLEHWQEEELMGLFSKRDDCTLELNDGGEFNGPGAVYRMFHFEDHYPAFDGATSAPPIYLHLMIPICGIVDVEPDGKTAKGRWYGSFLGAMPRGGQMRALLGCGIWENEYIKEDGIWKIWKLFFSDIISSPLDEGWVKNPFINNPPAKNRPTPVRNKDWKPYPSGYLFPYHYKNPVTGK